MIDIDPLNEAELISLNHRVVARLKFLKEVRAHAAMLEFHVGDRVTFNPEGRGALMGVLIRYNRKTVTVITDGGEHWNVAPTLIRKSSAQISQGAGANVVPIKRE